MEDVGDSSEYNNVSSLAVNRRLKGDTNQTEIYFSDENGANYHAFHESNEYWSGLWTFQDHMVGALTEVRFTPSLGIIKVFFLDLVSSGLSVFYYQWGPEEEWVGPTSVVGPQVQRMAPSVIAWNNDNTRLDMFVVSNSNNHLLHASWDSDTDHWSDFEDLHGFVTTPPVAVSRSPGIIDVFALGGDSGLWHISYNNLNGTNRANNGTWSRWNRISDNRKIQGQPDAISITSDKLDVFAWGDDSSLLHKSYDSASQTWTPEDDFEVLIEGTLSGPPKTVDDGSGNIHIFAYDNLNRLIWRVLGPSLLNGTTVVLANVPMGSG